jgi:membrane-associated phospholipid phosphatase
MKKIILCLFVFSYYAGLSQSIDLKILKSLNKNEKPLWDNAMWGVSVSIWPAMPLSVATIWLDGYTKNDKVLMRNAYKSAVSIGLASLTSTAVKFSVNRKRPKAKYPDDIIERDRAGRYSFPSGHTTSAFAMATALTLSYQKWYVAVPAYAYACMVGYSRMRLGMHFPSDVLGGMVIGIGTSLLVFKLDEVINRK